MRRDLSTGHAVTPRYWGAVTLRDAWEAEAGNWVEWARRAGHDSYGKFHRDAFLELLHPINSAGKFASDEEDADFVIRESYFERRRYVDRLEKDGLTMTFTSDHRSLEGWLRPLEEVGFVLERVREIPGTHRSRWQRIPLFLHVRAVKPERR